MMTASFGLMSCDDNDNATDEVKNTWHQQPWLFTQPKDR